MKKLIALILVIIISSFSMVSCQSIIVSLIHKITDDTPGYYTYTEFTDSEKELFETNFEYIPPFIPTDEYNIVAMNGDGDYSQGVRYYSLYNTWEDFNAFIDGLTDFTLDRTHTDEYGDKWYYMKRDNLIICTSFYHTAYFDMIDVFIYTEIEENTDPIKSTGYLKNDGMGLPYSESGVYEVDFTKSEYAQDLTDLYAYKDSCPPEGSPAILVIPVQFSDVTAASKGYNIDTIKKAFNGNSGSTSYYSVDEYYYLSSYGALDLDITVLDSWFTPEHPSSYYTEQTIEHNDKEQDIGDQMIMDEALDYLDDFMDLSKFDTDGNGYIDAVVMINTLAVSGDSYFTWGYRYWNIYKNEADYLNKYDYVSAGDYAWMSYGFMHEDTDRFGRPYYTNKKVINTKTYIHEIGHILGAEDYYDTSYEDPAGPLYGKDIMDTYLGDHNPYTKFSYGWIETSRLVTTSGSITLTLEDFSKNGDTIIVANNFDPALGVYQEYYVIMYYKPTGLNNSNKQYFDKDGIVIYHVNASLYYEEHENETLYQLNHDNDSGEYGKNYLIELVGINIGMLKVPYFIFTEGMVIGGMIDDNGEILDYVITVDSLGSEEATLTFKKIK